MRHFTYIRLSSILLLLSLVSSSRVLAQSPANFERILLPVLNDVMPGMYGSLWTTEVWVHNSGNTPVDIRYPECHVSACPATFTVGPQVTEQPPIAKVGGNGERPGKLLWVLKTDTAAVSFSLRVQDLSRQASTWGTEIPVIRESEFLTGTAHLLNVPSTDGFRLALRIYDAESRAQGEFRVRIYDQSAGTILADQLVVTVGAGDPSPDHGMPGQPGSAEISPLATAFGLPTSVNRVRIEVTPITVDARFWTLVSVTNNETQHVTTITPQ